MVRYLETLFRHRLLFAVPVVLALAAALGYELSQPAAYESTASLWFDAAPSTDPAPLIPSSSTQPADQESTVLRELLSTRAFSVAVAHRGPLAAWLAAHPDQATGLAAVKGIGGLTAGAPKSLDDRAIDALSRGVTIVVAGPQELTLKFSGPSAEVAAGTDKAIIDQFSDELVASQRTRAQAAVDYYRTRVQSAQTAVADARAQLNAYIAAHNLNATDVATDATAASLTHTLDDAQQRLDALQNQYDQATLDLNDVRAATGFRVIDPPITPAGAVSTTRRVVYATGAGLLVGGALAMLGVVLLTLADRSARRAADLERALGVQVVGVIARHRATAASEG